MTVDAQTADGVRELSISGVGRGEHYILRQLFKHRPAVIGLLVLTFLSVMSFSAPLWLDHERVLVQDPGAAFAPPSVDAPFGRDEFGRDAFARAVYGGRISLAVAFISAGLGATLGTLLGLISGYVGGIPDSLTNFLVELVLTLPPILVLVMAAAIYRPSMWSIALLLGLFGWPPLARIIRAEVLAAREREYVVAAIVVGCTWRRTIFRHILPNALAPAIVGATLLLAISITAEAAISFLGFGIQPPTPSWGNLLTNAQSYLITAPFLAIFPGLLILITVLSFNMAGDGLRDAFDPRVRS